MALKSLVIDASTVTVQAGVLEGDRFVAFSSSTNDTLSGFFSTLSPFLNDFHYNEIIFCEGPGKLIGIHSTLMFTRIAKIIHPHIRIYSYSTLAFIDRIRHYLSLPPEGLLCASKNNMQYYIFDNNQISLVEDEVLQRRKEPIYCLSTHHRKSLNHSLIPIKYNLKNHADVLRTIITPNEAIETAYDPQNEYKKWNSLRHKSIHENS
jgi:hypothetical protein